MYEMPPAFFSRLAAGHAISKHTMFTTNVRQRTGSASGPAATTISGNIRALFQARRIAIDRIGLNSPIAIRAFAGAKI